jgi:hypothetical protein
MVLFVGAAPQMRHSARNFLPPYAKASGGTAGIIAHAGKKSTDSYSPVFAGGALRPDELGWNALTAARFQQAS